jgi:hypothetical protein
MQTHTGGTANLMKQQQQPNPAVPVSDVDCALDRILAGVGMLAEAQAKASDDDAAQIMVNIIERMGDYSEMLMIRLSSYAPVAFK